MSRWVRSLAGDTWINLDRVDGVELLHDDYSGDCVIVVERPGRPNSIVGRYPSKAAAVSRVQEMIGAANEG